MFRAQGENEHEVLGHCIAVLVVIAVIGYSAYRVLEAAHVALVKVLCF